MCATFLLSSDDAAEIEYICGELTKKYGRETAESSVNTDFYPRSEVPIIGKNNHIALLRWGFPLKGSNQVVFNARAESLGEKAMYKGILSNRCLVPATSFYEWDKEKRKYRISVASTKLFYMAALWKAETLPDNSKAFYFTIITTEPNQMIGTIHNRMPAIISFEDARDWLNENDGALRLLRPYKEEMTMIAV